MVVLNQSRAGREANRQLYLAKASFGKHMMATNRVTLAMCPGIVRRCVCERSSSESLNL